MATQRLRMRQLREILRLHHDARLSHRAIARACRVNSTAVCEYLDRALPGVACLHRELRRAGVTLQSRWLEKM